MESSNVPSVITDDNHERYGTDGVWRALNNVVDENDEQSSREQNARYIGALKDTNKSLIKERNDATAAFDDAVVGMLDSQSTDDEQLKATSLNIEQAKKEMAKASTALMAQYQNIFDLKKMPELSHEEFQEMYGMDHEFMTIKANPAAPYAGIAGLAYQHRIRDTVAERDRFEQERDYARMQQEVMQEQLEDQLADKTAQLKTKTNFADKMGDLVHKSNAQNKELIQLMNEVKITNARLSEANINMKKILGKAKSELHDLQGLVQSQTGLKAEEQAMKMKSVIESSSSFREQQELLETAIQEKKELIQQFDILEQRHDISEYQLEQLRQLQPGKVNEQLESRLVEAQVGQKQQAEEIHELKSDNKRLETQFLEMKRKYEGLLQVRERASDRYHYINTDYDVDDGKWHGYDSVFGGS